MLGLTEYLFENLMPIMELSSDTYKSASDKAAKNKDFERAGKFYGAFLKSLDDEENAKNNETKSTWQAFKNWIEKINKDPKYKKAYENIVANFKNHKRNISSGTYEYLKNDIIKINKKDVKVKFYAEILKAEVSGGSYTEGPATILFPVKLLHDYSDEISSVWQIEDKSKRWYDDYKLGNIFDKNYDGANYIYKFNFVGGCNAYIVRYGKEYTPKGEMYNSYCTFSNIIDAYDPEHDVLYIQREKRKSWNREYKKETGELKGIIKLDSEEDETYYNITNKSYYEVGKFWAKELANVLKVLNPSTKYTEEYFIA